MPDTVLEWFSINRKNTNRGIVRAQRLALGSCGVRGSGEQVTSRGKVAELIATLGVSPMDDTAHKEEKPHDCRSCPFRLFLGFRLKHVRRGHLKASASMIYESSLL